MSCWMCGKRLTLREYAWDHRHEPPWYLKALGAAMMGIGLGSVLVGARELF